MEVGLGSGHIVLDGNPAPPPLKGHSPQFSEIIRFGPCRPSQLLLSSCSFIKTKIGFLKPSCFLTSVQRLWKIDCTYIILSFKDIYDVSAILPQNAFDTTLSFTDAWRLQDFLPRLAPCEVSKTHKVSCCSGKPWTASIFPSFDKLLLSILFTNVFRVVLLNILCWNCRSSCRKRNPGC